MRLGIEVGKHTHDVAVEHGIKGVPISADLLVTVPRKSRLGSHKITSQ